MCALMLILHFKKNTALSAFVGQTYKLTYRIQKSSLWLITVSPSVKLLYLLQNIQFTIIIKFLLFWAP